MENDFYKRKVKTEMAKDFSKAFYNSRRWRKNAKAFAESKCWICSRCHNRSMTGSGTPRMIVHHKTPLTPENIHDDSIAYGWDNLELLCIDCHNAVHAEGKGGECQFDADGNPTGRKTFICG